MKKVLVITLVLVFAFSLTAFAGKNKAIKAGDIVVGGAADFGFGMGSSTGTPEDGDDVEMKSMDFGFGGFMGYFVIDGLEIGPALGVAYGKDTTVDAGHDGENDLITSATTYDIGAQIGYFFGLKGIVVPYGMLRFAYMGGSGSTDNGDTEATMDMSGFTVGPKAGVDLFLTNKVAVDLGLFLDYESYTQTMNSGAEGAEDVDMDYTDMDYGLAVGINVFF